MPIKFSDVMTRADWIKVVILGVVGAVCWVWVFIEYQKPIIPPEWGRDLPRIERTGGTSTQAL